MGITSKRSGRGMAGCLWFLRFVMTYKRLPISRPFTCLGNASLDRPRWGQAIRSTPIYLTQAVNLRLNRHARLTFFPYHSNNHHDDAA